MSERSAAALISWWIAGAALAFSLLALVSIGLFTLLPALGLAVGLLMMRVPGAWMFLAGAGTLASVVLISLILDPNAPSNPGWQFALALSAAVAGYYGAFQKNHS